jgi:hypothetical protein
MDGGPAGAGGADMHESMTTDSPSITQRLGIDIGGACHSPSGMRSQSSP